MGNPSTTRRAIRLVLVAAASSDQSAVGRRLARPQRALRDPLSILEELYAAAFVTAVVAIGVGFHLHELDRPPLRAREREGRARLRNEQQHRTHGLLSQRRRLAGECLGCTASGVVLCGVPRSPDLPRKCGIRAEERRKAWVRESRGVIAAAEAISHDDGVGTHDEGELSGHERQVVLLGL